MKEISDDDLVLLYYGEHDEHGIAARVAASEELSARFTKVSAELELADNYQPPRRGEAYGAEVWQRISPRLDPQDSKNIGHQRKWLSTLLQPRFSFAGALSLVMVVALAFMLGRNDGMDQPGPANVPQLASGNDNGMVSGRAVANIDPDRLLSRAVSGHLEQVNLMMTQFVNSTETTGAETGLAIDMLVANRLYRRAASAQGKRKVAAFLADLEPILIELAYEAQADSPVRRERMQEEIRSGLLFRVRVMNQQITNTVLTT